LGEPIEFFEQLINNIQNAKNNIILSSLYIGNGDKEARLYNAIEDFLSRGGKALIILDFNRGQRGKISSKTTLQSIQTKYPASLTLKFFKSELMDQSKIASKIPQLKETVSTQHTKIYICDEKLILSGANLESAYFTNRQDRYIQFENTDLVNFFTSVAHIISTHSYSIVNNEIIPSTTNNDEIKASVSNLFTNIAACSNNHDTIFYPNVQAGWHDINVEEFDIISAISSLSAKDKLYFCSGYFNPPKSLCEALKTTPADLYLLGADARSNGFYKTKFPKSGITPAYQIFAENMESKLSQRNYILEEWFREKWTFHAKGMWFYNQDGCFGTTIGSSNFSCRSQARDLEAGGIILTRNAELMKKFELEQRNIWKYNSLRKINKVPTWVKFVAPRIRSYF